MAQLHIIDTFETFLPYWENVKMLPQSQQIDAWHNHHMAHWPELRQKQLDIYAEEGEDWRAIAGEFVFPPLPQAILAIHTAHDNLLTVCQGVYNQCRQKLQFDSDLVCVIYIGIGVGAGWATSYQGNPAVLFGLENIAQENWQEQDTLSGLMAHELGHLVHFHWRKLAELADETDPWWQLYSEGFAQYSEQYILNQLRWHINGEENEDWLGWCEANVNWLVGEFLRRVDEGEDIRPFFGSWFNLQGYKQTGYFLGYYLINLLRQTNSLQEIALLAGIEDHLRPLLQTISQSKRAYPTG
jgi:hypothetical protein